MWVCLFVCLFVFVRKALLHMNYHFGPRQQRVGSHPYIWKKVNSGKWMAVSLLPLNNKHVHFSVDIRSSINISGASRWLSGKNQLPGFNPWVGKIPWRRKRQSTPVFLPGKSHGQRWWATVQGVAKELDSTTIKRHQISSKNVMGHHTEPKRECAEKTEICDWQ